MVLRMLALSAAPALVGAPGRYASARGSVTVLNQSKDGKVALNVYTLSL